MRIRHVYCRTSFLLLVLMFGRNLMFAKAKYSDPEQTRAEYVARLTEQTASQNQTTSYGGLWVNGGLMTDMASDYKARNIGDTIVLQVSLQTASQSSGDINGQRSFTTSSAITALPGKLKLGGVNPLFGANSATQLKGQGEASNNSSLTTNLTARVIAVLPNQNMVVEAQREVFMNNQHETMFVRGMLRPGDIGPNNTAPSSSLANLEIELKGKGSVSDFTGRANPVMRALLWVIGF